MANKENLDKDEWKEKKKRKNVDKDGEEKGKKGKEVCDIEGKRGLWESDMG